MRVICNDRTLFFVLIVEHRVKKLHDQLFFSIKNLVMALVELSRKKLEYNITNKQYLRL
jgi:hypothetical protein